MTPSTTAATTTTDATIISTTTPTIAALTANDPCNGSMDAHNQTPHPTTPFRSLQVFLGSDRKRGALGWQKRLTTGDVNVPTVKVQHRQHITTTANSNTAKAVEQAGKNRQLADKYETTHRPVGNKRQHGQAGRNAPQSGPTLTPAISALPARRRRRSRRLSPTSTKARHLTTQPDQRYYSIGSGYF